MHLMRPRKAAIFALSNAPDPALVEEGRRTLSLALGGVEVVLALPQTPGPRKFAGDDSARAACFNQLLEDGSVDLLVSACGGYGVTRILHLIDFDLLRRSRKTLCGYSDVSALLLAAMSRGCTRLIHGPMICSNWGLPPAPELLLERNIFLELLDGRPFAMEDSRFPPMRFLKQGRLSAPLVPTNLTMLASLLGTPFMPDLKGCILAIEDVNEPAHAIDRKLNQLKSAGVLPQLAGLLFGHFTLCEDAEFLPGIMREYAECVKGPVAVGFPLGHDHPVKSVPLKRVL